MSFVVQVAADIFQNKTNFELSYKARPSLAELTRTTEAAFSAEIALRRPSNVPHHTFHLAKFKVYDEDRKKWIDLLNEGQLYDYCQVYAFQPDNAFHKETPKEIPPAIPPPATVPANASSSTTNNNMNISTPSGANGNTNISGQNRSTSGFTGMGANVNVSSNTYATTVASSQQYTSTTGALAPYGQNRQGPLTGQGFNNRPSVDASTEEKVRIIFAEFDIKGHRMLELEDLRAGFKALGLEFSAATMGDLFQKGDINSDGRISFSEFERFTRLYPIMTDCLFYRSKAFWDEEGMAREIAEAQEAARTASTAAATALQAVESATARTAEAVGAVTQAENDIRELNGRLRDLAQDAEAAQRERERLAREKHEREGDMAGIRERERTLRGAHAEAMREMEKGDRRVAAATAEATAADQRVQALQQQLAEAQRASERAYANVRQVQSETDVLKVRERDAAKSLEAVVRELPRVEEALRNADLALVGANDRIRDLDDLARGINRDAEEAARRRDMAERGVQTARDAEAQATSAAERARLAVTERERIVSIKQAELAEAQRQRALVSQDERALIEQELRLREQRDSLEQKESRLKSEAGTYLAGLRSSIAQGRGFSRDPSTASEFRRNYQ